MVPVAQPHPEPSPGLRELLPAALPRIEQFVRQHLTQSLRDREAASDLVHSVCGDLLSEGVQFEYRGEEQFHDWLRTVVAHKIVAKVRFYRASKRGAGHVVQASATALDESPGRDGTPSQSALLGEHLGLLDRALGSLPAHYREVIVRRHLRGESHAAIASSLGMSVAAVKNLVARAKAKLAGVMERAVRG